jgi:ribosomal protein S27AE
MKIYGVELVEFTLLDKPCPKCGFGSLMGDGFEVYSKLYCYTQHCGDNCYVSDEYLERTCKSCGYGFHQKVRKEG